MKVIYTDSSMEFGNSCEDLSWNHRTSTLHPSETKGMAERAARRIKEGTSAVLLQSGFDEKWWACSMECYCHLPYVQDLLADRKTLHERRFGEPYFKGRRVRGPKFRSFFSSPAPIFALFLSLGVFSWNFGGVLKRRDPQMCPHPPFGCTLFGALPFLGPPGRWENSL